MKPLVVALTALSILAAPAGVAVAKDCPPGLAKKNPPCVPPGQAKKQARQSDRGERKVIIRRTRDDDRVIVRRRDDDRYDRPIIWGEDGWRDRYHDRYGRDYYEDPVYVLGPDGRIYEVGDRLDLDDYVLVPIDRLADLPLLDDGHTYVRAGGKVVEMVETTGQIVRTIGAVHDLLN